MFRVKVNTVRFWRLVQMIGLCKNVVSTSTGYKYRGEITYCSLIYCVYCKLKMRFYTVYYALGERKMVMLRTALIGLGRIGWYYHLEQIFSHPGYSLCAVVDPDEVRRNEAFEKYGVLGYENFNEMLQKEHPDLVVIASPTLFHEEQTIAAISAGADVLLDKPMASDLEGARRIEKIAHRCGRKIVVYQPHRCTAVTTTAQRILSDGKLGKIIMMKRSDCGFVHRNDWQAFLKNGGGMLNNYGAHYIDHLMFLAGGTPHNLYCRLQRILCMGDAEDVVKVIVEMDNGVTLDVDINQATAIGLPELMLFGDRGTAQLIRNEKDEAFFDMKYYIPTEETKILVSNAMGAPGRRYPSEKIEWVTEKIPVLEENAIDFYKQCYEYFTGNQPSPIPLEDTMCLMQVLND